MSNNRVLINALSARDGGGQTYLINIIKYYERNDLELFLLLSKDSKLDISHRNLKLVRINFPVENPITRAFWEIFLLPFLLVKLKIRILFCPGGVVPRLLFRSCKLVTMFRNMLPFDNEERKKYKIGFMRVRNWLLSKVFISSMQRADLVIFISKYSQSVIEEKIKSPLNSSKLIPHGVDFDSRVEHGSFFPEVLEEETYILYPSTIDVYKSHLEVVEAYYLASLKIQLPKLFFVGSVQKANKSYAKEVRALISQYKLEDQIIFLGHVPYENMPKAYKNAEFIIFASRTENCPNILLEALSLNCLVICSNYPPMPEFAEDAVIYFDPKDPEELANCIEGVIIKKTDVKEIRERIPDVINKYSWQVTADETWESISLLAEEG